MTYFVRTLYLHKMRPNTPSVLSQYTTFLSEIYGVSFSDYESLHSWSIREPSVFWESIVRFFSIEFETPYQNVYEPGSSFWKTKWFSGATLNYSQHIFKWATTKRPALIFQSERGDYSEVSWSQLIAKTYFFQQKLMAHGVVKGDAVVCFATNSPETIAAFLATNALGAVWSSCSPDFGTLAVCERFEQLQPKFLFAHGKYHYNGKQHDCAERITAIQNSIPSIKHTVFLDAQASFNDAHATLSQIQFTSVSFSAPIWVLFSSGTTGKPKALVHGTGHMLLEHVKALGLHQDVVEGDRYFWYSTTGWMMWNYALSSLLLGATLCLYQGAPMFPVSDVLWRFASKAKMNHFGGGAVYFQHQMELITPFLSDSDFSSLKTIGSTGSPLSAEVCKRLQVQFPLAHITSISGGTDVCTAFVGGHPDKEVVPGEIQCKMLGAAIEVWNSNQEKIVGSSGELVLTAPFLSMPIKLQNDENFTRYKQSYFSTFGTVWSHGDWAMITKNGGVVIYGRSDATLNRHGVRIGTAEIYAALNQLEYIDDALVIHIQNQEIDKLVLFLQTEHEFVSSVIKAHVRKSCSPRHVPDVIYSVPEVPYTISGKKVEIPVKRVLQGEPLEDVVSVDALRNPDAMQWFVGTSL